VGHAGTLDPMASGLLVVALGQCTRLLEYLPLEPKTYEFSVTFGRSTDTLDAEGNVTAENDVIPSKNQLIDALKKFTGKIEQVPPAYSAIKIGGVPAYRLARKGVDLEMKPRTVTIYNIEMTDYDITTKRADFTVDCSSGTYVRSLAFDIVKAADTAAEGFVSKLRRTRAGRFNLSQAINFSSFDNISSFKNASSYEKNASFPDTMNYIITTSNAFDDSVKVTVSDSQKADISKGRPVAVDSDSDGALIAFDEKGTLSAVLKRTDGNRYHPEKVFIRNVKINSRGR